MELRSTKEQQLQVISVQDTRIDAAVALVFKDQFRDLTDGATLPVILDLTKVEFIDSSGLGVIVAVMKILAPDRTLALAGLNPAVERVFTLTRMDTVFAIYATLQGALNDLQSGAA